MSRLDSGDAERSARYQSPQNGVVATSLRSTLQHSLYVVDPPARWANRRSVPRGSSPMRMQPGAQLQMHARNRSLGRASARRFSAFAPLAPNQRRRPRLVLATSSFADERRASVTLRFTGSIPTIPADPGQSDVRRSSRSLEPIRRCPYDSPSFCIESQ